MSANKTRPTNASPTQYVNTLPNEDKRKDCRALMRLMARVTGKRAKMWGPSIIGYGSYHYRYESGREGDMPMVGFAPRGREIVLYVMPGFEDFESHLAELGRHRVGKSCLYIRNLESIDLGVLEGIVAKSFEAMRARHG